MRKTLAAILFSLAATLSLPALPALAASEEEVSDQIEQLHGQAAELAEPLLQLREAVKDGRPQDMVDLVEFPLRVNTDGSSTEIGTAEEFIESFPTLLPPATRGAIGKMEYKDLIVTSDGVGLADGAVWMSLVCEDDACGAAHSAVTSINL